MFHTKAFHIYFPAGYDSLGSYIAKIYPEAAKRIKHNMATGISKEPNIIIYPSADQYYESNIGLFDVEGMTFPTVISATNRMVLAFNGSYTDLSDQLHEAIARSIWEAQVKEEVQTEGVPKSSKIKPDVPMWFKEGAISYFAHQWPIAAEDALKLSWHQNSFKNWQQVIAYQPKLSGQAFCYFLNETYYQQAVLQLYGQLKKKNLQRSLRLITKRPMDSVYNQCFRYYNDRFATSISNQIDTGKNATTIPHKRGIIRRVQVSPDNNYVAYTSGTYNKRTVWIYDIRLEQAHKVTTYQLAPWITDHMADIHPLLRWNGSALIVTKPVKGKLNIRSYTTDGKLSDKYALAGIDGINQIEPVERNTYLLNAHRRGESDAVSYNANKDKYATYTNDIYEDGHFSKDSKGQVFFTSNRPQKPLKKGDTLKLRQGIYAIQDKSILPVAIDSNKYIRWDKPTSIQGNRLLATHTLYGTERFAIINNPDRTNQVLSLSDHRPYQYQAETQSILFHNANNDSIKLAKHPIDEWIESNKTTDTVSAWLKDYRRRQAEEAKIDSMLKAARDETPSFLEGVLTPKNSKETSKKRADSIAKSMEYSPKRIRPYILQLHSAYFTAKVNNDYFINRYQPYANYQGQFKFPEIGGMIQSGFTDLLENHHVNIAFRLPAGTEGSDFFFKYQNKTKKLDWGFSYFRKVESLQADPARNWVNEQGKLYPNTAKVKTHYYELALDYPLTYELGASFQTAVRADRTIFLATDNYSLPFEDIKNTWSINTLSLQYNRLQPTVAFLYKGFRAKTSVDAFQDFSSSGIGARGTTIQGTYYQPLYRYITLVVRASGGYSGGKGRVLYNLGGMDNNVVPKVDSTVQFPQSAPYVFQTLITPFRGHLQNTLAGDRYALLNADVYFPIFQTLIPLETPLQAINLLQLGMFTDAASATEGWNPAYASKGWVWSYGLSARTELAGYPLRVDVAWPGTFSDKPVWYFSLNLK